MNHLKTLLLQRIICGVLLPAIVLLGFPPQAYAWKPRTHALGVNTALYDAIDGHMCFPGISTKQIPIGAGPLIGLYAENGQTKHFNDLPFLGPYLRAGAIGPDGYPDVAFGQLAIHVDHSRMTEADTPFQFPIDELNNPEYLPIIADVVGEPLFYSLMRPLMEFNPSRRSIEYGHEVMKEATSIPFELLGRTRSEILNNDALRGQQALYQASSAFSYGYFMHMAGDGMAHSWINDWVGQPFSLFTGRKRQSPYLDPGLGSAIVEELGHMAIEKYVDIRYKPTVIGDSCEPVDAMWHTESTSICDVAAGTEFPIDCDLCNPLRDGSYPPDAPLADSCDVCFDGCNPWREVCEPTPVPLPCSDCKDRRQNIDLCETEARDCLIAGTDRDQCTELRQECITQVENRCTESSYQQCCDVLTDVLVNANVMTQEQVDKYTCQNPELDSPFDLLDRMMTNRSSMLGKIPDNLLEEYKKASPQGCFQGAIHRVEAPDKIAVDTSEGEVTFGVDGEWGLEIDLNGDGETDLINECMLMNCLTSPGTCPLRALKMGLPPSQIDRGVMCEVFDQQQMLDNPDALLNTHTIDMPHAMYKKIFLERRYPETAREGDVGTYALGGYIPNSVYMMSDAFEISASALETIRHPLLHVIDECVVDGGGPACELSVKIAAVRTSFDLMMVVMAAALVQTGTLAIQFPFIGVPLFFIVAAQAAIVATIWTSLRQGFIPGFTLPLRAKQAELLEHLEEDWYTSIVETADALSGQTCTQSCAGFFPDDNDCTQHRFLALQEYFDWAFETYDIVDSFDCNENNYLQFLPPWLLGGGQTPNFEQTIDLVESGGTIIATQYLGCLVLDWQYQETVLPMLKDYTVELALDAVSKNVCTAGEFYVDMLANQEDADIELPSTDPVIDADGNETPSPWTLACDAAIRGAYGQSDDPRQILEGLRELVAALDEGGLTQEQRELLYPLIEQQILTTSGVEIDMFALDELEDLTSCAAAAGVVTGTLDAREFLYQNLRTMVGDEAVNALASIDQQIGNFTQIAQQGFDQLNPVPSDIDTFFPMYNTLQLDKAILLGDNVDDCERKFWECIATNDAATCASRLKDCAPQVEPAGLRAMSMAANEKPLREAFNGAYSTDLINTDFDTFNSTFFQEQHFEPGSSSQCEETNFNVMCNSIYSLDDPDDYCRTLDRWNTAFFGGAIDSSGVITECSTKLDAVDDFAKNNNLVRYQPDPRVWTNPDDEIRLQEISAPWLSTLMIHPTASIVGERPPHRQSFNTRSLVLEKVIPQDFGFNAAVNFEERSDDRRASYYPFETSRFSLANKDSHVTRLYSNLIAPFYCPSMGEDQKDWDCDAVPDDCDICPQTYNPDQRDMDRNGIGDDCPLYNPATGKTPSSERWSLCESDHPILVWDAKFDRYVFRNVVGKPGTKYPLKQFFARFNKSKYQPIEWPPKKIDPK